LNPEKSSHRFDRDEVDLSPSSKERNSLPALVNLNSHFFTRKKWSIDSPFEIEDSSV
jgi:hypothetical protein